MNEEQHWIGFKGLDDAQRHVIQANSVMVSGAEPKWRVIQDKIGYIACLVVTYRRPDGKDASVLCAAHDVVGFKQVEQANIWLAGNATPVHPFLAPKPWPDTPPAFVGTEAWGA